MAHYRDLVQNQKGLVREWCDSTPVTLGLRYKIPKVKPLATEGWKWALKVHEQGEVDSNRWNRCRLLLHSWLGQIEFWDLVQMNRQMTQAQDRKRPCLCITYEITR